MREFIHNIYIIVRFIVILIFLYIFVALAFVLVVGTLMDIFLK
nr:MAG TPA: hypothetical protein [Caudoviricetes sp.]